MTYVKSYPLPIDKIPADWKKKEKIVLQIKFTDYPNFQTAVLHIYSVKNKKEDGTGEKPIVIFPGAPAESLASGTFVLGISHFDLKLIFDKKGRKKLKKAVGANLLFTPVLSTKYPENLVFSVDLQLSATLATFNFGQSNPCPPAPPGIAKKKKKKK